MEYIFLFESVDFSLEISLCPNVKHCGYFFLLVHQNKKVSLLVLYLLFKGARGSKSNFLFNIGFRYIFL